MTNGGIVRLPKGSWPTDLPYSPVVMVSGVGLDFYYLSGILPEIGIIDMKLESDTFEEQAKQALEKARVVLGQAGLTWSNVTRVWVRVKVGSDTEMKACFRLFNDIYREALLGIAPKPAREFIGVAFLPFGALIEITIDAVEKGGHGNSRFSTRSLEPEEE